MGQYEYNNLRLSYNGDTSRLEPEEGRVLYRPRKNYPMLTLFDEMMARQKKPSKQQKLRNRDWYPGVDYVEVTVAASAGATTLYVNNAAPFVKNRYAHNPATGVNIKCTSTPAVDATSVSVAALAYDVPKGTVLQMSAQIGKENWERVEGRNRSTGFHYDYCGLLQHRMKGMSLIAKEVGTYGPSLTYEVSEFAMNEFAKEKSAYLWHSAPKDGSADGDNDGETHTRGILYGARQGGIIACNGVLDNELLDEVLYEMRQEGNAEPGDIRLIMCQQLKTSASSVWLNLPSGKSVVQMGLGEHKMGWGPTRGYQSAVDDVGEVKMLVDDTLAAPVYRNCVIALNIARLHPIDFGRTWFQGNVQDPGVGRQEDQVTVPMGWSWETIVGAARMFTDVERFQIAA